MEIKLEKIRPQSAKFSLQATGEHELRKVTLDDQVWFQDHFGKPIEEVFGLGQEVKLSTMMQFIFHLLVDKTPFRSYTESVHDDESGQDVVVRVPGYRVMARSIGTDEQLAVMSALMKTVGISMPEVPEKKDDAGEKKEEKKPKAAPKKKAK
jgi:hypothetical protein